MLSFFIIFFFIRSIFLLIHLYPFSLLFFLLSFSLTHVSSCRTRVCGRGVCVTEMTVINLDYVKRDEGCEQRTTVRDTKQSEPSTVLLLNTCLRHLSSSITARAACVLDVTEQTLFIKLSCDVTKRPWFIKLTGGLLSVLLLVVAVVAELSGVLRDPNPSLTLCKDPSIPRILLGVRQCAVPCVSNYLGQWSVSFESGSLAYISLEFQLN